MSNGDESNRMKAAKYFTISLVLPSATVIVSIIILLLVSPSGQLFATTVASTSAHFLVDGALAAMVGGPICTSRNNLPLVPLSMFRCFDQSPVGWSSWWQPNSRTSLRLSLGATFYKAPVGSRIRIACNASHWNDDSISLVLWFKGNPAAGAANLQPIYTIDARQKPLSSGQARHLVADSFKGRAKFVIPTAPRVAPSQSHNANQTTSTTSALLPPSVSTINSSHNNHQAQSSPLAPFLELAPIEASDQAEYRCRVDYRSRPRENFLIILFVLVPPSSVQIVDTNGRSLEQIYGPLSEGSDLTLLCLSKGGRPSPAITWKSNGRVIDESYLTLNDFLALQLASSSGSSSSTGPGSGAGTGSARTVRASANSAGLDADAGVGGDDDKKLDTNLDNNKRLGEGPRRRKKRQTTIGMRADSINSQRLLWAARANRKSSGGGGTGHEQASGLWSGATGLADDHDDGHDDAAAAARGQANSSLNSANDDNSTPTDASRLAQSRSNLVRRQATWNKATSMSTVESSSPSSALLDAGEWLAWPEFSYFQLGPSEFFYRNRANSKQSAQATPTPTVIATGNEGGARRNGPGRFRPKHTNSTGSNYNRNDEIGADSIDDNSGGGDGDNSAGARSEPQLIDWQVDETITTGVNVLHVNELSRAHLMQLVSSSSGSGGGGGGDSAQEELLQSGDKHHRYLEASQQLRAGSGGGVGLPKLECHASNLHYDLRSLIKMFAPPSLGAPRANSSSSHHQVSHKPHPVVALAQAGDDGAGTVGRRRAQLMTKAIERALWSSLRSLNSALESADSDAGEGYDDSGGQQSLSAPTVGGGGGAAAGLFVGRQPLSAAAQKHGAPASERSQNGTAAADLTTSNSDANWPLLIYQQLIRPHQLASSSSSASALSSGATNPVPMQVSDRTQTGSGGGGKTLATGQRQPELARNKLIALETLLRPLDVKIVGPQQPLVAGEVSEFTCTSSGSRPAARLTWLKNGQRLARPRNPRPADSREPLPPQKGSASYVIETIELPAEPSGGGVAALNSSTSRSKLSISLGREDHRAELSCRAENVEHLTAASRPGLKSFEREDNDPGTTAARTTATSDRSSDDDESDNDTNSKLSTGREDSWVLEDSLTLDVHYQPQVRLELGNKMLSEQIREDQDIYFVCQIDSQPAVQEITWLHNNRPINETRAPAPASGENGRKLSASGGGGSSESAAIGNRMRDLQRPAAAASYGSKNGHSAGNLIVSNDSLVLQRVQLEQAGRYACMATNSEGIGLSNQIELRVLHAPICVPFAQLTERVGADKYRNLSGYEPQQQHHQQQLASKTAARAYGKLMGNSGAPTTSASELNGLDRGRMSQFELGGGGGEQLHLGSLTVPLNARSKLNCAMLSEPGGQVEFVWYLNNSLNERRVLFTSTAATSTWPLSPLTSDDDNGNLIDAPDRTQPLGGSGGGGGSAIKRPRNQRRPSNNASHYFDPRRAQDRDTQADKWRKWSQASSRGDASERRAARHLDSSVTRAAANAGRDQQAGPMSHVAVSQLKLNIEAPSDYGQLFCVAKNSIGQQKRACVYSIEPPALEPAPSDELASQVLVSAENNDNNSQATLFEADNKLACLAVNVTSHAAWIGCDLRLGPDKLDERQQQQQKPQKQQQQEDGATTQVDQTNENNQEKQRQQQHGGGRFKFNVQVSSSAAGFGMVESQESGASEHNVLENSALNSGSGEEERLAQVEANLTSSGLDEPLFALVNLRPNTNYLLQIVALDPVGASGAASFVRLTTRPSSTSQAHDDDSASSHELQQQQQLRNSTQSRGQANEPMNLTAPTPEQAQAPAIRQVTEPHRSDLVAAALISTRSASSANFHRHHSRTGPAASRSLQRAGAQDHSAPSSFWSSLAGRVGRLLGISGSDQTLSHAGESSSSSQLKWPSGATTNQYQRTVPGSSGAGSASGRIIKWINLETSTVLAIAVCLSGLIVTLIGLIALHRFVWPGAGARRSGGRRRGSRKRRCTNGAPHAPNRSRASSLRTKTSGQSSDNDEADEFDMKISCMSGGGGDMHLTTRSGRFSAPNELELQSKRAPLIDDELHATKSRASNCLRSSICSVSPLDSAGDRSSGSQAANEDGREDGREYAPISRYCMQTAAAAVPASPGDGLAAAYSSQLQPADTRHHWTLNPRHQQNLNQVTTNFLQPAAAGLSSRASGGISMLASSSTNVSSAYNQAARQIYGAGSMSRSGNLASRRRQSALATGNAIGSRHSSAMNSGGQQQRQGLGNEELAAAQDDTDSQAQCVTRSRSSMCLGDASIGAASLLVLDCNEHDKQESHQQQQHHHHNYQQQHRDRLSCLDASYDRRQDKRRAGQVKSRLTHSSGCGASSKHKAGSNVAVPAMSSSSSSAPRQQQQGHTRLIRDANFLLNSDNDCSSKQQYHNDNSGNGAAHALLYNASHQQHQFMDNSVDASTASISQQQQRQQQEQQAPGWHYIELANEMPTADSPYALAQSTCNCDAANRGRLALVLSQENGANSSMGGAHLGGGQLSSSMISDELSDSNGLQMSAGDNSNWPQIAHCNGQQVSFIEILPMIQGIDANGSSLDPSFDLTTSPGDGGDNDNENFAQQHHQQIILQPVQIDQSCNKTNLSINTSNANRSFASTSLGSPPSGLVKDSLVSSPLSFTTNTTPSNTESYQNNIIQAACGKDNSLIINEIQGELIVDSGNSSSAMSSGPDCGAKSAYRSILKNSNKSERNHQDKLEGTQAANMSQYNNNSVYDDSLTNL